MSSASMIQIIAAFFGSLGFAVLFNIRGNKLFWTAFGGLVDWSVVLGLELYHFPVFSKYFLAAIVLGVYSEFMSRRIKTPTTLFFVVGFIPLIPGAGLFMMMDYGIQKNSELFTHYGMESLTTALAITSGIICSMVLVDLYRHLKERMGKYEHQIKE